MKITLSKKHAERFRHAVHQLDGPVSQAIISMTEYDRSEYDPFEGKEVIEEVCDIELRDDLSHTAYMTLGRIENMTAE